MSEKIFKKKDKPEELIRAKQLVNEGKFDEAFQIMKNFEKMGDTSRYDLVSWQLLKCDILFQQAAAIELFELAEQTYKESLGLGKSLLSIDALYYWAWALIWSDNLEKTEEIIKQGEELLKTLMHELPKDYKQREASIAFLKGLFYNPIVGGKDDPDLALEHLEQCLALREEYGAKHEVAVSLLYIGWIFLLNKGELDHAFDYVERALTLAKESNRKHTIAWSLFAKASYYHFKGELDRSIIFFEQSLVLFKELNSKGFIANILNSMAEYYRMKGEIERALECSEQSVAQFVEIGILKLAANAYDYLIQILIEKGDLERAQEKLDQLEQMKNELNDERINLMFLFDKAILLKTSSRALNRGEAEKILKQILDEDPSYEGRLKALLNLCELLLIELRMTGNLEVLNDINSYITQLLDITEKSHSYWVLGETYLLQAKLALITLNLKKARRLLTKGQQIAEKYGLSLLAMKISNEHDELLKKLDTWENLKESSSSLKERMEFARLNEQMGLMVRKRVIDVPELSDEEPVLLLIVSEGGRPIFSQSFLEDQAFEDHLFGGFFTAINSFINKKFSEGLDRAIFGEHTLLMNSVSPFLICYVYKGQSYSAQHRIKSFINEIQSNEDVCDTFEKFYKLNKEIQLKDIPSLEPLINDIFMDKTIPLNS
ncbi:MAG: tetratricopeptide repeat protein [Candidatus Lokiarchaeia archaeon]